MKPYHNNSILVNLDHFTIITSKVDLFAYPFFLSLKFIFWRTFSLLYAIIYQAFMWAREQDYKVFLLPELLILNVLRSQNHIYLFQYTYFKVNFWIEYLFYSTILYTFR